MSDPVRPHRWQSTRLPHPWDSPGKNTGVGCHFLLQCMKVKVKSLSHVWLLAIPWTAAHQVPLSMGFSRQEQWSGVPLPSPTTREHQVCKHSAPGTQQELLFPAGAWTEAPRQKGQLSWEDGTGSRQSEVHSKWTDMHHLDMKIHSLFWKGPGW